LRIAIAAAEAAPFARVGGLSDVVGALSKAVSTLGHDVFLFIPNYAAIDRSAHPVEPFPGLGPLDVPMGEGTQRAGLFRAGLPGAGKVSVVLVGHDGYFGRPGIYVDPATGEGYPDEVERYAFFSRAVLEAARAMDLSLDVLHLNDHHTALAAVYLRERYAGDPAIGGPGVVFSIHNLGYMGLFGPEILPRIGFSRDVYAYGSPFEYRGRVSALKLGIEYADYVNTVSPEYAREIAASPEYGLGLEGVLAQKRDAGRLVGILNGVDYDVWDPSVDRLIPVRYSETNLKGKRKCKKALLKRSGLAADLDTPLIGMVSRLADQKGFDLLRQVGDEIVGLGASLVVLGTGQAEYHEFLKDLAARNPGRVAAHLAFDNKLAHWIEAGSDMFLMPSRYEPCGLNQMYSLRYGTVPIVRATGGLVDTVVDYDPAKGSGTGFAFKEYDAHAMVAAIKRAVDAYRAKGAWEALTKRGMEQDFGWQASAAKYVELYGLAAKAARVGAAREAGALTAE
jgi:starch synthase